MCKVKCIYVLRDIDFACFYDNDIGFWNCGIFFHFIVTVDIFHMSNDHYSV
jgi:hypothetical protein